MSIKDRFYRAIATCGGLGYLPFAPGTAAALVGVAIFLAVALLAPPAWQTPLLALALLLVCAATVLLARWAERFFGEKDSSKFVTDEVAGFLFTVLLFWPFHLTANVWLVLAWSFPLVRIIDVVKVPPARALEKLPGGWGVLADDLLSGLYAAVLLHILAWLLPAVILGGA